jgi:hypothetical protein
VPLYTLTSTSRKTSLILLISSLTCCVELSAQQKFRISGGVNGSAIGYTASGIPARRDPFYWMLSGNLTLSYWQITAPFSFTLSQQDQTFRYPQPFNQFGISPSYKSVTLHAGYRSMNFSEFTLAGTIFMGLGLDVAPPASIVKVSAMYGRLAKARLAGGLNDLEFGIPSYERWGYGTKITLGKNGQEVDLILFRGRDDPGTLPDSTAALLRISPAENFVWGINVRKNLGKRLTLNTEYALSAYTKDIRDSLTELTSFRYANYLGDLYTPTQSSQFNGAFQGQLAYRANQYQLNFKYRRLGPEYKTMGSPFMNNDFEDITGGIATAFFENRFSVAVNAGVQRNNLDHGQETQVKRFIGSVSTAYTVSEKLNISLSYSNFNSTTKLDRFYQQSQIDQIDSLLFLQVTNNISGVVNYNLKQGDISKSLILSSNYQVASGNQDSKSVFYNANIGYQVNNTPKDLTFNANLNGNSNQVAAINNFSVGPTATLARLFLKRKLRSTLSSSYIRSFQSGDLISENITARFGCSYATKTRHTFGVDLSYLNRISQQESTATFSEFRGGLTYNYSFSN